MKRAIAWALSADDLLNAVAVREFRQAVQSRWVVTIFMLFLVINLCVIGGFLMLTPEIDASPTAGRDVFTALFMVLLITCLGFVPIYSSIRLSFERSDTNVDLLFISTLTPGAIIRGKYLAAMAITLLIFSTCMPFLTITYLLRGIDLPTIFLILFVGFCMCAAANAVGILTGSVQGSWFIRGVVDVGAIIYLFYMLIGVIGIVEGIIRGYGGRIWISTSHPWLAGLSALIMEMLGIGLCYVLAVAMVSPKTANRMFVPRIYITVSWIIIGCTAFIVSVINSTPDGIVSWAYLSGIACIILTVAALGERDSWTMRIRRKIPKSFVLRRLAFLFYTGSAGGITWAALMFTATMFITLALCQAFQNWTVRTFEVYRGLPITYAYVLCYCLTIAAARPTVLRNVPTHVLSILAGFFGVVLCLAPYFACFFASRNWEYLMPWYMLGSPMVLTTTNEVAKDMAPYIVVGWLAVCLLISSPWWIGQWRRFKNDSPQ